MEVTAGPAASPREGSDPYFPSVLAAVRREWPDLGAASGPPPESAMTPRPRKRQRCDETSTLLGAGAARRRSATADVRRSKVGRHRARRGRAVPAPVAFVAQRGLRNVCPRLRNVCPIEGACRGSAKARHLRTSTRADGNYYLLRRLQQRLDAAFFIIAVCAIEHEHSRTRVRTRFRMRHHPADVG